MKHVMTPGRSRLMRLLVILAAAVLLTACGDKGGKKAEPAKEVTKAPAENATGTPDAELTKTPTGQPDAPTAEPTGEPGTELTKEPTAAPTAEPTAAPTAEPTAAPIEYGDILANFDKSSEEIIAAYNRDYRYEYWGEESQNEAEGAFTMDGQVFFAYERCGEAIDLSDYPDAVLIFNYGAETIRAGIGKGIDMSMTYSELKRAMGDELQGPVADKEGRYYALSYYHERYYYFEWQQSPLQKDTPAALLGIYRYYPSEIKAYIGNSIETQEVKDFLSSNETLLRDHMEQYREELRKIYKYEPVHKINLLATLDIDSHNTVEIYECAGYGCTPGYRVEQTEGEGLYFLFNGVDKTKERYDYIIMLRLLTDGQYIASTRYWEVPSLTTYDYSKGEVSCSLFWTGDYESEANALREAIGIPGVQSDLAITEVAARRPVDLENYSWSENISALYLNDGRTPVLIETYGLYEANDGGYFSESVCTPDGTDVKEELEMKAEGTVRIAGYDTDWTLYESPSGVQIIQTFTIEEVVYAYREYIVVDGCLILYFSRREL